MVGQLNPTADVSVGHVVTQLMNLDVPGLAIQPARYLAEKDSFNDETAVVLLVQTQEAYRDWLVKNLKINMEYNDVLAMMGKPIANDDEWTNVTWHGGLEVSFDQPLLTGATLDWFDRESSSFRKLTLQLESIEKPTESEAKASSDHTDENVEAGAQSP